MTYEGPDRRDAEATEELIKKTVHHTLVELGFDVDNPLELQADNAWVRKYRDLSEKIGSRVLLTIVTVLTTGAIGAVLASVWPNK